MTRKFLYTTILLVFGALVFFSTGHNSSYDHNMVASSKGAVRSGNVVRQSTFIAPSVQPPAVALSTKLKVKKKKITKLILRQDRTVFLLGQVGVNASSIARSISRLAGESNDPIYLIIDSPGGMVISGASILSAIEASSAPVYTICYRLCASMAAIIHQYGVKRLAVDRAIIMLHPATAGTKGDIDRMASISIMLRKYIDKMDAYITARVGVDYGLYKARVSKDLWLDAEDALAENFIDDIVFFDSDSSSLIELFFAKSLKDIKDVKPSSFDFYWGVDSPGLR